MTTTSLRLERLGNEKSLEAIGSSHTMWAYIYIYLRFDILFSFIFSSFVTIIFVISPPAIYGRLRWSFTARRSYFFFEGATEMETQ
jgi:hypothetical protein